MASHTCKAPEAVTPKPVVKRELPISHRLVMACPRCKEVWLGD